MKSPDFTLSPARVTLFAASPFFFETDVVAEVTREVVPSSVSTKLDFTPSLFSIFSAA